jgi:hypothetical protein
LHSFSKTKNLRDELGCTLHKVEMERRQRIASAMEMDRDITELQVALRARIRGLLAPMSITSEKKCMEFANRDFSAIVNIRWCAVLKTRPEELTWSTFWGSISGSKCTGIETEPDSRISVEKGWGIREWANIYHP